MAARAVGGPLERARRQPLLTDEDDLAGRFGATVGPSQEISPGRDRRSMPVAAVPPYHAGGLVTGGGAQESHRASLYVVHQELPVRDVTRAGNDGAAHAGLRG